MVPLVDFGWSEVLGYWSKVPEFQALGGGFNMANNGLADVLMEDGEYRLAMEEYRASTGRARELFRTKGKQTDLRGEKGKSI